MNIETVKKIVTSMNASREKRGEWGYKIDGKSGEIRIHTTICSVLVAGNKKEIDKIIRAKNESVSTPKHKIRRIMIQELTLKGRNENCLDVWAEEGISFPDISFLLNFFKENKHRRSLEITQFYQAIPESELFSDILEDLIPPEVFALLNKSQQQIIKLIEPTAQASVKPKRSKLTRIKRYRPAYESLDKSQKELAIVRHLQKLWGGEREAPTLSGNIDLLTADKLIEVKSGENWKHGIGQLISYGYHKPDYQQVLYLFDYENLDLANVRAVCGKVGIKVMLHE